MPLTLGCIVILCAAKKKNITPVNMPLILREGLDFREMKM